MKNALILGVNSTIGQEIFSALTNKGGYTIYTTSRTAFEPNADRHQIYTPQKDTLDLSALPDAIHEVYYLPGSINLKPFGSLKMEHYQEDLEINVLGFIHTMKQIQKQLVEGKAAVLGFSSVAATLGLAYHASVSTSKSALEGLFRALAAEFAGKVRYNTLAISLSNTQMAERLINSEQKVEVAKSRNPLGKIGDPQKIASFATVINSETCDWLSGESIHFDGGMKNLKTVS